jgi:hypothetical protein
MILYTTDKHDNYSESILRDVQLLSKVKEIISNSNHAYILVPFKVTKFDCEIGKLLGVELFGSIPDPSMDINDKIISRQICMFLDGKVPYGFDCYNIVEIQKAIDILSSGGTIVIKEFDGVSGQGFFIIHDSLSSKVFNAILRRHSNEERFRLLIEKWYDNCVDINYQIYIGKNGEAIQLQPTKQIINKGVYEGTDFQIEKYLSDADMIEIEKFGTRLAFHLHQNGYYGNISVDTIKTSNELFHLVEINARLSLSSYYWGTIQNYQDKKILIQYYNIKTTNFSLNDFYNNFCEKADDKGVFILSSGVDTLNATCRLFLMFFSKEIDDLHFLKSNAEEFMTGGNCHG